MDKALILQYTALFSVMLNLIALLSGYWAIALTQNNKAKMWNVGTIATTGLSALHLAADFQWYFFERGYAWPLWNFYQLMIFASLLILLSLSFVGFHFYVVRRFRQNEKVKYASRT